MSNLVMWNMIVGFLMPNVVALIQQPRFSTQARAAITALASVLGGLGTAYFTDQFTIGDVVGSILVTGVAAITFYKGFWKPTGVAVGIENATSKTPPTVQQAHPDDAPMPKRDEYGYAGPELLVTVAIVIIVVVFIVWLL